MVIVLELVVTWYLVSRVCLGFPTLDLNPLPSSGSPWRSSVQLTLSCSVRDEGPSVNFQTLWIEVSRQEQDVWRPIARIEKSKGSHVDVYDPSTWEVKGRLTNTLDNTTYIQVTWLVIEESRVYGKYRCDGHFLDGVNKEKITAVPVLLNVDQENFKLFFTMPNSTSNSNSNLGNVLFANEDTQTDILHNYESWPKGYYGLLRPATGCPREDTGKWRTGYKKIHTESSASFHVGDPPVWRLHLETSNDSQDMGNLDAVSVSSHLSRPTLLKENGQNYVVLYYCLKMDRTSSNDTLWPNGSYCIDKKGHCPGGFQEGKIYIDEEDSFGNKGSVEGDVPDLFLSSTLEFCCRRDGDVDTPMKLPIRSPFYLYRYGGRCQQVREMDVVEEFVLIDSEDTNNNDQRYGAYPDGAQNDVRLELCYYVPT
uniref:Apextrin C-terminal domain-containing protein n=1 Tax=Biomphalaria glabrata TaxID=6526 RepID=A0A2C9JKP1_BIOGL